VADRYVSVTMILSDPQPGFQGHCIVYKSNISKTVRLDKVTTEHQ